MKEPKTMRDPNDEEFENESFASKLSQLLGDDISSNFGDEDSVSNIDGTTTSKTSSNGQGSSSGAAEKEFTEELVKKEQKAVRVARYAVIGAIVLAAAIVTGIVYTFATQSDTRTFELEYQRVTKTLIDSVQWQVQYNFALMQMLSAEMTTAVLLMNSTVPNFTHPQFEVHGGYTDGMGGIMMSAFAPFIQGPRQQRDWEAYAQEEQGWLNESARLREVHPSHRNPLKGTFQSYEGDRRRNLNQIPTPAHRQLQEFSAGSTVVRDGAVPESTPPPREMHENGEHVNYSQITQTVFRLEEDGTKRPIEAGPSQIMAPLWQSSPRNADVVNVDLLQYPVLKLLYDINMQTKHVVMSPASEIGELFDWMFDDNEKERKYEPHAFLMDLVYPTFDNIEEQEPFGFVLGMTSYRNFFDKTLPEGTNGVVCVVKEECADPFTYNILGKDGNFAGYGDLHDPKYDPYEIIVPLEINLGEHVADGLCPHTLHIYPSQMFEDEYKTNQAMVFTSVVVAAFAITAIILLIYDLLVTRRQNRTMQAAIRSNNIVSALFPKAVRDRMMADHDEERARKKGKGGNGWSINGPKGAAKSTEFDTEGQFKTAPIADYFSDTTVIFADLVGFTAWSSVREPAQVFMLLETIYHAFDVIAKRRKVFKVETVGDCYVAVTGLPNPNPRHAILMARFARECMNKMWSVVKRLETSLGPDTGDLTCRIGIHSGPVTAGVLRGERSRFQLFGDTMNTAARMESNGIKDKIHISQATADLLIEGGKESWITPRTDQIDAKGKGVMQTYWLSLADETRSDTGSSNGRSDAMGSVGGDDIMPEEALKDGAVRLNGKMSRLVDWNVDGLFRLLKQIAVRRKAGGKSSSNSRQSILKHSTGVTTSNVAPSFHKDGQTVLDEVAEVIELPKFDAKAAARHEQAAEAVVLPPAVHKQLKKYVTKIALRYHENPFHNFEHASHVTMSITKLLSRIQNPNENVDFSLEEEEGEEKAVDAAMRAHMHDNTFGITSDPLTQFACVLSGLIHDLDHPGVPNSTLTQEDSPLAKKYQRSIAEQNSVDISWDLLMEPEFSDLRAAIYSNDDELARFRQLVVNAVLATDIVDKDLKALRNLRWEKAFSGGHVDEDEREGVNRKATIVIEHLIQASDVAHTMQHWHIYRKWNERFFLECYKGYIDGRAGDKDPSEFWYKGEMGFFDFYIIPLAKKLKDCGVFGVSSDEYLNYATRNREEWELKGQEVVADMVRLAKDTYGK